MHGRPTGPVDPSDHTTLVNLHEAYEMKNHAKDNSQHSDELDAGFYDRNLVIGSSKHCVNRLRSLWDLGIRKFVFPGSYQLKASDEGRVAYDRLTREVIPAVQEW